jgi:hypothetical protein
VAKSALKKIQGNQTGSGRGGRRPGAGRKKGVVSEAKRAIAEVAKDYAPDMLKVLVKIAGDDEQPAAARVTAATAVIDRGYGKPTAPIEHGTTDTLADAFRQAGIKPQSMPISTAQDED